MRSVRRRRRSRARRSRSASVTAEVKLSPVSLASSVASLWASSFLMFRCIAFLMVEMYTNSTTSARQGIPASFRAVVRGGEQHGFVRRTATPRRIRFAAKAELGAVTRSQLERAVLERIGLDHDDFLIRVAVVAFGREGDVAVDAGVLLELVEIADDLFRFGDGILHRFRDQVR